jgi:hypothetical protein
MNHEELLADVESENFQKSRNLQTPYLALRAVIKLHTPDVDGWCNACGVFWLFCPTIRTIVEELA